MKTYRAVLVGTGSISEAHVRAVEATQGRVTLDAAVDIDAGRVGDFTRRHGIPHTFTDYDVMLRERRPDIVLVATPPAQHGAMCIAAMDAGAWVLCEKPLCGSLSEFDLIEAAEQRTHCYTACIFQMRFGASTAHLKRLADNGHLGRPLVGVCNTLWYRDDAYYAVPWRGRWDTELGGPTMGLGIHAMDHFLHLMGDWTDVRAIARTLDRAIEVEDVSMAIVSFANGAVGSIVNSALSPRQETYIRLDYQRATVELTHLYSYTRDNWKLTPVPPAQDDGLLQAWHSFPPDVGSTHGAQLNAFVSDMDARRRPLTSGDQARQTLELLTAIYKSAFTNEIVTRGSIRSGDSFYNALHGSRAPKRAKGEPVTLPLSPLPMSREALAARTITGYLWGSRDRLWRGLGLALLRSLAVAPCPWLFQRMIDGAVPAHDSVTILALTGVFLLLLAVHYVCSVWGANEIAKAMAQMMVDLRSRLFFKLQFLSFGYLDQQKTGRLLSKYAFDTQKVEALLYNILNQFLPNLLYGASIFVILAVLNWRLALALALVVPAYGLAKYRFFTRIQRSNSEARLAQEKLTGTASEYISALRLVRSFGEEKQAEAGLDRSSAEFARHRVQQSYLNAVFGTFWYVSSQVIALIVMAGGALLAIHGKLSYGTLFAFVAGLPIVLGPIQAFVGLSEQYFIGRESYLSIKELLDSTYVEEWRGTRRAERIGGDIVFDRIAFAYPIAPDRDVLHDINLSIRAGEHVAFVGPSGSGKSTLVNLLLGLYAPTAGRILIDGEPQSVWDMRWIRRQLAVVLQDSLLLSGSISDNLRFARAEATDTEVQHAARQANAEEFIARLPDGYHTLVGERGASLSGGQRQRLAIARAILRDPPVLILDEATSALDYESERLIQEALDRLCVGRTVITIAHRLSTIRNATRIIVLAGGSITEEGDFADLVARGGAFARLVAAQNTGDGFIHL